MILCCYLDDIVLLYLDDIVLLYLDDIVLLFRDDIVLLYLDDMVWRAVMTMRGISTTRKRLITTISIMVVLLASRCLQFLIAGTADPLQKAIKTELLSQPLKTVKKRNLT